jgi:hypothetical protein
MTSRMMSAMPTLAVPAPWMTTRWSRTRVPAAWTPANAAASTTAAVPCMSSLKVQTWSAYRLRMRQAFCAAKSSPVQHRVREHLGSGGDVRVDEVVVALVADPGVSNAEVHLVAEQRQVVGTHVEDGGNDPAWVDASGRGVGGELADAISMPPTLWSPMPRMPSA